MRSRGICLSRTCSAQTGPSRFIRAVTVGEMSFLFTAEGHSTVYRHRPFFLHFSVAGHPGHLFAITQGCCSDVGARVSFRIHVWDFFGEIPTRVSSGSSVLNVLRSTRLFPSGCLFTVPPAVMTAPFSAHPRQHLSVELVVTNSDIVDAPHCQSCEASDKGEVFPHRSQGTDLSW